MTVCLITYQYPPYPGGVGSAIYRIAKNLAKRDVDIHIIAPGPHQLTDKISPVTEDSVTVHRTFSMSVLICAYQNLVSFNLRSTESIF